MNRIRNFINVALMACLFFPAGVLYSQQEGTEAEISNQGQTTKTRLGLLNELSLREALVKLEKAKEEHDRTKSQYENSLELFKKKYISQMDLNDVLSPYTRAQQALKTAEIELERTKLGFLANATHITIMEAKKYYDSEGKRMLDLVLKNTSNLTQAESALGLTDNESQLQSEWQSPEQIQALLDIENIIVSIVSNNSSIGKPYEKIIPVLLYGEEIKLTFVLLTDVQEAGIRLKYLEQNTTENIFLEKESLQEKPTAVASQFSVEGQLGSNITFDLVLEMLVTTENNFSLVITNMPPQINCFFVEGGARITSVRFTEEVDKHNLILTASIPQKLDVNMIDKKIDFQAWIATSAQLEKINKLKRQYVPNIIPANELDTIDAARVDLTLIPRGTGRLDILINNLFEEIKPQQDVNVRADLYNDGTLTLFNIIPEITPPLDWEARVEPNNIERLLPNEKQQINIHLQPGTDVGVGEYEARIEVRGQSGSDVIEAIEKRLKVWIVSVILLPSFGRIVFDMIYKEPTQAELQSHLEQAGKQVWDNRGKYGERAGSASGGLDWPGNDSPARARLQKAVFNTKNQVREDHHNKLLAQAFTRRNLACISPVVIYRRATETIAGTGINRCVNLYKQVNQYRADLKRFVRNKKTLKTLIV